MIENTIRPELFFRVIDVTNKDRITALNEDFAKMGSVLAQFNDEELLSKSIEHHQKEFENKNEDEKKKINNDAKVEKLKKKLRLNGKDLIHKTQNGFFSIVFCPVKGTEVNEKGEIKNKLGVAFVFQNIASTSKGYFFAADGQESELNKEVQKHFQDFIHGRTKHIVCTKAFGMGIDKKNIRTTYHYVYSSSLESFVQEAGRAGRDRHIGVANILVNTTKVYKISALALLFESQQALTVKIENPISDLWQRKSLRMNVIEKLFSSREDLGNAIDNNLADGWGFKGKSLDVKQKIKQRLLDFTHESYQDRGTHDFFFKNSFQGIDSEKSQVHNLFHYKEFYFEKRLKEAESDYNTENGTDYKFTYWEKEGKKSIYVKNQGIDIGNINLIGNSIFPLGNPIITSVLNFLIFANQGNTDLSTYGKKELKVELEQETLKDTFKNSQPGIFDFMMAKDKVYPDAVKEICTKLGIDPEKQISPPNFIKTYREEIVKALDYSHGFNDFILRLKEIGNDIQDIALTSSNIKWLRYYYNRDRNQANTGRLIYRMQSMGLLVDYTIDYKINGLHHCKFQKYDSIEPYIKHIESYLRRYLSENSTSAKITILRTRLAKDTLITLIGNILECLYFLAEFAYEEIADKRKRATDEIEKLMNESVCIADTFEQNKHIKEEIFYYFNAKYARRGFKIDGNPFSLLDDYDSYRDNQLQPDVVLDTYLKAVLLGGAEQNNYKHLMGSCRKILRSLPESDLNKDWVLRLLRAFAMYAVNNPSYISEANEELELGFQKLFKDTGYHKGNFSLINQIFEAYFKQLKNNIDANSSTFKDINLVQLNLMFTMQSQQLQSLLDTHTTIKTTYHG
jgi:ATP-dependent DNA helicase RecQ